MEDHPARGQAHRSRWRGRRDHHCGLPCRLLRLRRRRGLVAAAFWVHLPRRVCLGAFAACAFLCPAVAIAIPRGDPLVLCFLHGIACRWGDWASARGWAMARAARVADSNSCELLPGRDRGDGSGHRRGHASGRDSACFGGDGGDIICSCCGSGQRAAHGSGSRALLERQLRWRRRLGGHAVGCDAAVLGGRQPRHPRRRRRRLGGRPSGDRRRASAVHVAGAAASGSDAASRQSCSHGGDISGGTLEQRCCLGHEWCFTGWRSASQ
mmetsp:Transcript_27858/g.79815  ORF Transcript_27858/g.79815 Transcript_27858/m.79815 type:complete len:267 (+) Transcript_27858:1374-2174(+)